MSEIKAAMLLMLFFVGILFPGILQFSIDAINQNAFTKNTKEYTELVQEEAGLTNKSKEVKERLESKGYQIKLTDQSGNTITGTVGYGNTIKIAYSYKYKSVFKHRTLKSSNVVLITKRDSTTAVRPTDPNNSSKTIRFITEESKDIVHLKSIDIPNLKTILQINSNTGNVFVQNISGNTVELKMDDGGFSRQVQIEGNYIKGEEKYVTNHTSAYYKDNEGYEGNLTKYLLGGHLIRGKQKYIGEHTTAYYKDKEGYEGELSAYAYSGNGSVDHVKKQGTVTTASTFSAHQRDYKTKGNDACAILELESHQNWVKSTAKKADVSKFVGKEVDSFTLVFNEEPPYSLGIVDEYGYNDCFIPFRINYTYSETVPGSGSSSDYRYQGIVKQPDIDTRSWGYQGIVSKNSIDTRTFEKYYQYEVEIVYEVKE